MADLTSMQIAILRHALGLNEQGHGAVRRNHLVPGDFVPGYGIVLVRECDQLVDAGMMTRHDGSPLGGGRPIFVVTEPGRERARADT